MTKHLFNQVCYKTFSYPAPERHLLATYQELGGYKAWKRIIDEKISPADVVNLVKDSGLRG